MKTLVFTIISCAFSITCLGVDEPTVKVISVIDGNTIEILTGDGDRFPLMLKGIDCPDSGQNHSLEARKFLEELLLNKQVILTVSGKDRYGNRIGEIRAEGMTDPRIELIRAGLAWTTESNDEMEALKEHARAQGLGLWEDENPTPPWLYRRQQSMLTAKGS